MRHGDRGALSTIERTSPDLVFLDIQMPQIDGLTLARTLGRTMPAVVFVTSTSTLGAFEVHALDYLLKPYSAERFKSALMHARQHLNARRKAGGQPSAYERRDRLVIKSSGRICFIRTRDVDWCEAAGSYVRLHVGAHTHLVRGTMAHIECSSIRRSSSASIGRRSSTSTAFTSSIHPLAASTWCCCTTRRASR